MTGLNNTKNWREYIFNKFSDSEYYEITQNVHAYSVTITVNSKTNDTFIDFMSADNWNSLSDVQYSSEQTYGWSGETVASDPNTWEEFSQSSIDFVEELLETPISKGWISYDYYLSGKHYKSKVYEVDNEDKSCFIYYSSNYGCLSLLFSPIFIIIDILIKHGFIGEINRVVVTPIERNNY